MVLTLKVVVLAALAMAGTLSGMFIHETGVLVPDSIAPTSRVLPISDRVYLDHYVYAMGGPEAGLCPGGVDDASGAGDAGAEFYPGPAQVPHPREDFVLVSWVGEDNPNGNGIDHFDVQYKFTESDSCYPAQCVEWNDWQLGTQKHCALFTPENAGGHYFQEGTYLFRCRAVDRSGNVEAYPEYADAAFHVTYYYQLENLEDAWEYYHDGLVKLPLDPNAPQ